MTAAEVFLGLGIIGFALLAIAYFSWEERPRRPEPTAVIFIGGLAIASLLGLFGPRLLSGALAGILIVAAILGGVGSILLLALRSAAGKSEARNRKPLERRHDRDE